MSLGLIENNILLLLLHITITIGLNVDYTMFPYRLSFTNLIQIILNFIMLCIYIAQRAVHQH